MATERGPIVPPAPVPPERDLSLWPYLRAVRDNAVASWPARA